MRDKIPFPGIDVLGFMKVFMCLPGRVFTSIYLGHIKGAGEYRFCGDM